MEPIFPTVNDVAKRVPESAILKSPPLTKYMHAFPVPVGLFEDTHQYQFWEVSVRMFGSQLLKLRDSNVGIRATGILKPDGDNIDIVKKVIETRADAQTRWQELLSMEGRLPSERQEAQRREDLLKIKNAMTEYWMADAVLEGRIEAFLNGLPQLQQFALNNVEDPFLALGGQVAILNEAINAHAKLVKTFINNVGVYDDRLERNRQLACSNRNMKAFNTQIKRLLAPTLANDPQASGPLNAVLNTNERALEFSRFQLFSPQDLETRNTVDGIEYTEVTAIGEGLRGPKATDFHKRFKDLQSAPGTSLFITFALNILEAMYNRGLPLQKRQKLALATVTNLQSLRYPAAPNVCPSWWTKVLDEWIVFTQNFNNSILQEMARNGIKYQ